MHLVAEQRSTVGISIEIETAPSGPQLLLHRLENLVTVVRERIIPRPYPVDDLHPWIMAVGVDRDQSAAGADRPCERCNDAFGFKVQGSAGPVRLVGGD